MPPEHAAEDMLAAARVCNFPSQLHGTIVVAANGSMHREWLRVPVDFVCGDVQPQNWQPMLPSKMWKGRHLELLHLMGMV